MIVEENLRDDYGHYGNFVRGMAEHLRASGAAVEVWAHRRAEPHIVGAPVRLRRLFAHSTQEAFRVPRRWRPLAVLRHNARFFAALWRGGAVTRPPELTIATSANLYHLAAWRCWLALTPRRRRLVLVLLAQPWLFKTAPGGRTRIHRTFRFQRALFRSFVRPVSDGRCVVAVEVARQGRVLRGLCGLRTVVVPIPPARAVLAPAARTVREKVPLRLGFLGSARSDKGVDCLVAAIRRGGERWMRAGAVRFVVQCEAERARWDHVPTACLRELARENPGLVEIVEGPLGETDYASVFASLDGLLLPYRRSDYFVRGSGIATEAFGAGLPVICTAGTWIEEQMRRWGAGVAFPDGDAAGLEAAIDELLRHHAGLAAVARERSAGAREEFSWPGFFARVERPAARTR